MLDIKHIARVLYDNRSNPDYNTGEGRRRILAENGNKLARRTYDGKTKEINAEIQRLHDLATQEAAKKEANLEDIFPREDYIKGLKEIWDSAASSNKDRMQAGEQAAKFFGWNAPAKTDNKHSIDSEFIAFLTAGRVKVAIDAEELPADKFKEIE